MTQIIEKPTAVDKALIVLDLVGQLSTQGKVKMADLVKVSGLQRPTVHRLLATLKLHGLVTQDEDGFRLGGKVLALAAQAQSSMDIRRLAKPLMERFSELTGLTVHLAILDSNEVVYIDKIESRQQIVLASGIGWRGAVHCTALGKAMTAFADDSVQQAILALPMAAKTQYTLTTPTQLQAAWAGVKQQGYAIDDRENEVEVRCVAAPILDSQGRSIVGISISGTCSQVTEERAIDYGRQLAGACNELSQTMGYNPE